MGWSAGVSSASREVATVATAAALCPCRHSPRGALALPALVIATREREHGVGSRGVGSRGVGSGD